MSCKRSKDISLQTSSHIIMRLHLQRLWIFALFGVLISYNLDFECLLATSGDGQSVCLQSCYDDSSEDSCADPLLGSIGLVSLPFRTFFFQPFTQNCETVCSRSEERERPPDPELLLSVGLRAPPFQA